MAPKTPNLSQRPSKSEQARESSEEESEAQCSSEENSSDDETEEGSFGDDDKERNSNPPISVPKSEFKPIPQENGSDSDSESEESPSSYKMQPIRKASISSAKRTHQEVDSCQGPSTSVKKPKSEVKKSLKPSSTPGITRLWSNADEIAVLNGIIDFRKAEGSDPNSEGFYNFIKGKLESGFSKDQLRTKITRLKKRFLNASKKGDNGFSKSHDMALELAKKIWGNTTTTHTVESAKEDTMKAEQAAVNEKNVLNTEKDGEEGDFWSKYPYLNLSFDNMVGNFPSLAMSEAGRSFLKERVSLIGNDKAKEFDEKWKQLVLEQTELNYKMLNLMTEQVRMALNQQ